MSGFGAVSASAERPAGERPDEEPGLYYKSGGRRAFVRTGPVSSLTEEGFDRFKCHDQLLANQKYLAEKGAPADACGKCVVAGPCAFVVEMASY